MLLHGKVVLITGAARGIGRVAALVMADEGADVAVADILPEVEAAAEEVKRRGSRSIAAVFDIADPSQVNEGVQKMVKELGTIHILVNNAGIVNNIAKMTKMTHEAWSREISVNLSGAFNMIKEVIGPMIERKWGRIVNVSSLAAHAGLDRQVAYAASKAGLLGLTKTVALEHARDGITCNAILPGLIETELVRQMPEEIRNAGVSRIPTQRMGSMEEVGHLITFLASDRAAYINGEEICVDGGLRLNVTTLGSRKDVARGSHVR
jgi:NAD(P)-dependent dehydrogenase (short-subunit alcohol dehydrogenase family)